VAGRTVSVRRRKACTSLGRTSKGRRGAVLLLREVVGAGVRFTKTEAAAQRRAKRLLASGPDVSQAREVIRVGRRWYCAADLVGAGSVIMLVAQFVPGQTNGPAVCNGKLTATLEHGERSLRLWAVCSIGLSERVVVSYGGSAGRRVVAAVRATRGKAKGRNN
jgi:hypothetical protein